MNHIVTKVYGLDTIVSAEGVRDKRNLNQIWLQSSIFDKKS